MSKVKIIESSFGFIENEKEIKKFTLSTNDGFEVSLINYGATIQSIRQPDKNNHIDEITLGYDHLQNYIDDRCFFGPTVGRVAGRIRNARFQLNGEIFNLNKSDSTKKHYLHGVFHKCIWNSETENDDTVVFKYRSPDGEDFFPGQLDVTVKYRLTTDHRLIFDFFAKTTKTTPINMTNHVYFNLSGDRSGSILDHEMIVPADFYLPLDDELIPTGEISSVEKTPFDFRTMKRIGDRFNESFDGYDMMFIIDGDGNRSFGKIIDRKTGRAISIESTQKGLQFYTGNFLNGVSGRGGNLYQKYGGFCLETQNFTDSLNNQPRFCKILLQPNEEYHEQTTFHFHLEK